MYTLGVAARSPSSLSAPTPPPHPSGEVLQPISAVKNIAERSHSFGAHPSEDHTNLAAASGPPRAASRARACVRSS